MSAQSDYERYSKGLSTIRKQIGDASQKVASARKSEVAARGQASRSSSASTTQSKLREAERYADAAAKAERARADLEGRAADKEKRLYEARARADKDRDQAQLKLQKDREKAQATAIRALEGRLRASQAPSRQLGPSWTAPLPTNSAVASKKYDLFISHASEDKPTLGRPLYEALSALGLSVWFDEATLTVGDSLRAKIEEGLANSTFGVVVLSHSFFAKEWPQAELNGLHARQMSAGVKVILPIWHNISKDEIVAVAPMLADTLGLSSATMTVAEMAQELAKVVAASKAIEG